MEFIFRWLDNSVRRQKTLRTEPGALGLNPDLTPTSRTGSWVKAPSFLRQTSTGPSTVLPSPCPLSFWFCIWRSRLPSSRWLQDDHVT